MRNAAAITPALATEYPGAFHRQPVPTPTQLASMAKRMVAASCCSFLQGVDRDNARLKERWLPYQQWLGLLRADDSILTFNYDRVVETLEPSVGANSLWGVHVCGVDGSLRERDDGDQAHAAGLPLLYKLHGSVNWNYEDSRVTKLEWIPDLLADRFRLAIATPGDGKMEMAGGIFKTLWTRAARALREADDVFIMGFRFPQSDAFPRDRLLAALAENAKKSLNVHVVLGPDRTADLQRVLALL